MATRVWYGTDNADYFMNIERTDVTLMSSFAGDDTIVNAKSGVSINTGTDNNLISLAATGGVSLISGGGKDTVDVATADDAHYYNYINISGGNNLINNSNILHSTIKAGTGSDTITSGGYFSSIVAGSGNNRVSISTEQGNNTITAASGNDFVSIKGASGSNYINVGKGKNTVKGGTGNANSVLAGDGNNFVTIGGGLVSLGNASTGSKISLSSYGGASVISGTGNDTLNVAKADGAHYYNYISISGGNNRINNSNILHSTILAGSGSDIITSGGYFSSILAGDGDNRVSIITAEGNNTVTAGTGNNYVSITGASGGNVISLGTGSNTVIGGTDNGTSVTAGDGGSYVTIGGGLVSLGNGEGDRVSVNTYGDASVISGAGNEVSLGSYGGASVISGTGNDTLNVATSDGARYKNFIDMGDGDNYINNSNIMQSTIKAGTGNDTIKSGGYFSSISAGDGNNRISLTTVNDNNTVTAGDGNNYVSIKGASGGNVISLGNGNNTVKGGTGNGSSVTAGDGNSRVTVGGGLVSLGSGTGNRVSIGSYGGASVISGTGKDTIDVVASDGARYYNFISISGGNNRINNSNILHSTIVAGKGSDMIITGGYFSSIKAGNGHNRITVSTEQGNNTIVAGTGKDLVSIMGASGNNYINVGKGNNTVYGGTGNGNSVLGGAGNSRVTIGGGLVSLGSGDGNRVSIGSYGGASVISGTGKDTIDVASIDSARYYDFISISGGNNLINNGNILHSTIKAGNGSDTITSGGYFSSILAGGGNNRISIVTDQGNNTVTAASGNDLVSITGASGNNYINVGKGNNTVIGGTGNGNTVLGGAGNSRVTIGGGLVTLGNGDGNEVSIGSYGGTSVISGSGNDTLNVTKANTSRYYNFIDMGGGDNYINNSNIMHSTISAGAGNDTIITGGYFSSISAGDGDNLVSLTTSQGDNTIITGAGNDTILGNASGNLFVYAGGNDFLGESATGSKISLTADGASDLSDISGIAFDSLGNALLTFDDDKTLTVENAAGLKIVINDTTRVLGENAFYSADQQSVTLTSAYTGDIDASKFTNFSAAALGWPVVLLGNVLSNNLVGGSGNDKLYGVAGNDTLKGNAGDDTLTGGAGNDLFIYTAGKDVVTDMSTADTLQIGDGTGSYSTQVSGSDIVVTAGDGSVILTDAATLDTLNIAGSEALTITAAKTTLPAQIVIGDATARTAATRIVGNALDNSILGGTGKDTLYGKNGDDYLAGNNGNDKLLGQNGNDTLWGGAGNDTLTGGAGADLFIYTAGKDVVTDFADEDLLQITGTWTAAVDDKSIAFTVGKGSLTLKNFTATTFNINDDAYVVTDGKMERLKD